MKINYNEIFRQLLTEYNLANDLSFSIALPARVQAIINDQILLTDQGITLKSFGSLYPPTQEWENQSIIENSENHFHVDWHIVPPDNRKSFMLAVTTLLALATRFEKERIQGVRFWLSFQTPELGELWAKANKLNQPDDEYYLSDRLSFYTRCSGEEIVIVDNNENSFWAILTIDI